ncbi:MAG: hypothetical protein K9G70_06625 [Prolixibacteraceae bacterium]|nr:hypothetical protein [Prolixibacteraceae bacterium]
MRDNIIIVCLFVFCVSTIITSCGNYKVGYISEIPFNENHKNDFEKLPQLKAEKEILNFQSKEIMKSIEEQQKEAKALQANELNLLFENLQKHLKIDSVLHHKYMYATNITLSDSAKQMILESAVSYNILFQNNKHIRRIINRGDMAYDVPPRFLAKSQHYLWSATHKDDVQKQIKANKSSYLKKTTLDNGFLAWYYLSGSVSKIVASVISMSHLEPHPEKYIHKLMPLLEKGDIICQKSGNRLSDKFIPGYFGHVAIYLGDSLFAEVILNGTVISKPLKFAEGDTYLIIRHKNLTPVREERVVNLTMAQMDKKYDFQYDAESPNELTCAELIYIVYDFVKWETGHTAGRYLITPDNIVSTACKDPELEFISFFDKKNVVDKPKKSFIKKLIKK